MAHFKVKVTEKGFIFGVADRISMAEKLALPTCLCGEPAGYFTNLRKTRLKTPAEWLRWRKVG